MSSIVFPSNPAKQTPTNRFSPTSIPDSTTNGITYTYDGTKWEAKGGGALPDLQTVTEEGNTTTLGAEFGDGNIKLDENGSAEFAGTVQAGGDPVGGAAQGTGIGSYGGINAARITGTDSVFTGYTVNTTTPTISLLADGSASFEGGISAAGGKITLSNTGRLFAEESFRTGSISTGSSSNSGANLYGVGSLDIQRSSSGNIFRGFEGTSENVTITAAGEATFAGNTYVGDSASTYAYLQPIGDITIKAPSGSTDKAFGITRVGDLTYSTEITADGAATFAGTVEGGAATGKYAFEITNSDGAVGGLYRAGESAASLYLAGSGSNNIELTGANGSAKFSGTVEQNATRSGSVEILLQPEDESQYEITTETYTETETYEVEVPVAPVLGNQVGTADEPETQTITKTRDVEKTREIKTYVGPVLDVKESIRSIQSALYRLKAAVLIPDSSVDELRLRILEALENISTTDVEA